VLYAQICPKRTKYSSDKKNRSHGDSGRNRYQLFNRVAELRDLWDWDNLSDRAPLTEELLAAYSNHWNWSRIINRYGRGEIFEGRGIFFYEQFKDYIPEAKLQDSSLWNEIIKQTKKQIINDIVVKG
jgi:hypothetical protein